MQALIFDCDGVLVDTERDGHRVAFNKAFEIKGLDVRWSVERYGELLSTGGGKERMRRHFDETDWPGGSDDKDAFIADLHKVKGGVLKEMIEAGHLTLRPGVARLVDEALGSGIKMAVCSTSNEKTVATIVAVMLGAARAAHMPIFAGDMVAAKKPDPAVYNLAKEELGLDPAGCVVIEDSAIGLRAALAAGMNCIVTTAPYTEGEDFQGAARVVPELGDGDGVNVTLDDCRALCA